MPVVYHSEVVPEPFKGGATYQTLVGDEHGSTPIRVGIQTSPPGYKTPLHSHPYMETITVLEGEGEAGGWPRPRCLGAGRHAGAQSQHSPLVSSHRRSPAENLRHSRVAASGRECSWGVMNAGGKIQPRAPQARAAR